MQDVRVIGVESGALLLATDTGSEFRLAVTSSLPGQVRQANPDGTPQKRVSPKDIQARIRSGATAEQVAMALDTDVEYVRRYEGPVLAERSFILDAAQRVHVTPEAADAPDTFGGAIAERLEDGEATDVAWASWKHPENGWLVQVVYRAEDVEHDAQWRFDPKTSVLSPENGDAHRLSDSADEGIAPRLRAVEFDHAEDSTRFDSGAFLVESPNEAVTNPEVVERQPLRAPLPRIGTHIEERPPGNETADLLEALRRRRGEREAASFGSDPEAQQPVVETPSRPTMSVVDVPLDAFDEDANEDDVHDTAPQQRSFFGRPASASKPESAPDPAESTAADTAEQRPARAKRSRRAMPSWDEIVFGTRPDDDPA
jgi:hypothetical protein